MSVRLDNLEAIDVRPITRALISVYDKTGLIELATALAGAGVEIVSTGSTAAKIAEAGVPVTPVDDVTGFPEVLEGRVKTLHPMIHAGILADQRKADHREQIDELGVKAFDLVICNLYPFTQTVAGGGSFDECVEQIDIGGPSMVRAAAKNHPSVAVVTSPDSYAAVIEAAQAEGFTLEQRRELAARAFAHTATYDLAISGWFADQLDLDDVRDELDEACETHLDASDAVFLESLGFAIDEEAEEIVEADDEEGEMPAVVAEAFERVDSLRYGENPHQNAAVYREIADEEDLDENELLPGIANARQLHGKAMSYNNYTDGDAALRAAYDHERPCVAIIKHANPCGIAVADDVAEAHRKAHACDPVSAFGGVIAVNRPVTVELAKQIVPIFTEVVLAPGYDEGALEVLSAKKNLRVLEVAPLAVGAREFKQISGGLLVQDCDDVDATGDDPANWTLAAGEAADAATLADLEFAWRTVRAVRSNAILLVKDEASVGVGMGQVNRVDSCKLAVERANTLGGRSTGDAAKDAGTDIQSAGGARAEDILGAETEQRSIGAVAASDAFFPFADGLQVLIDAGVKAVVQPGGSVRDEESIEAAKAAGITMYMTGTRHFAH
ncbi:bifunctional phosphoribosylaminoimidazolecarboxamide formyltransferase/IMP cyclohydrolase [Pauljensenia sp. UMB1235]|uniref:bifunctional phosphoribosylaminoimidazolecarboxamide formyltransferase/IMP cyclohydrolase n=1 Tax=unclassified Pauljensenia TaxID=2908895 RepID=UPI002550F086|nr:MULTISPECIES: bifunctional phosphoribosylaminoimidazolecarboxamide formyltransferase/IMP cyclohydrolase [unclassified Pauljensenia]MDK6400630.1 bifunctional phosphoribosylaminoimidazolecarboxamide formyltransferase/IMP cyclohydrolase [Pauljensenia sp. UMB9872]MDK7173038.1 bifunctional phosphoribosylaminoimidazolecarboxamide formyltransferase/IMP cyclohydrolase [Pauljensenia sp. UMB1235]